MAVGTALVMACSKEQALNQDTLSNQPAQEELTPQDGNIIFAATPADMESRTTIENGSGNERIVKWAVGDEIAVWWASDGHANATAAQAGTSSSFSVAGTVSENYYAGYPASAATALNDGVLTMTVPTSQDGSFASANMMAAHTTDAVRSFAFYNVTGLLKFAVEGSYTSVVFRGAKGETVTGSIPVSFTDSGISTGEVTGVGHTVTVALNGAGTYYISILPGTFSEGFAATFYQGDEPTPAVYYAGAVALSKGQIADLGTLDARIQADLFVTPSGAGTKSGRSWDNAMGTAELKDFIEQPVDGSGTQINAEANYKATRLDGITFHMAAGDYYLTTAAGKQVKVEFSGYPKQVKATFLGGYPTGLTGTSKVGRDATQYCSAFTGNNCSAGIFILGNQTDLSFDGITFKEAGGDFSAAVFNLGAGLGNCSLSLDNCRFVDNVISRTGACIYAGKSTVTVNNCLFSGNSAGTASCIHLNDSPGNVSVSGCTFTNNQAATGGVVNFAVNEGTERTARFSGCTFSGNSGTNGGVIRLTGTGSVSFTGCTVSGNHCDEGLGGFAKIEHGNLSLEACTLSENYAKGQWGGGAVWMNNNDSRFNAVGCTFRGNYCTSGLYGGVLYDEANAGNEVSFADCLFEENYSGFAGGVIYLGSLSTLKMSSCMVRNNHSDSRGMIQCADECLVYLSRVTFSTNRTGIWGTVLNSGGSWVCMNNVTSYNNYRSAGSSQSVTINTSGSLLITNSTFVDNAPTALIRAGGNANHGLTVCNNVFINTNTQNNTIVNGDSSDWVWNNQGWNIWSTTENTYVNVDRDWAGRNISWFKGSYSESWDASGRYGIYQWNLSDPNVKTEHLVPITESSNPVYDTMCNQFNFNDTRHGLSNVGADFYGWLEGLGALGVDGRNQARSIPGSWWPGAYQGN